jgi:hypothetical protein
VARLGVVRAVHDTYSDLAVKSLYRTQLTTSMDSIVELTFLIEPIEDHPEELSLTPVVSGIPLTQLVTDFERERNFDPVGGYGGLVPNWLSYGSLERYFEGQSDDELFADGFYLVGCECGDVGCWPLLARIERRGAHIVWDSFAQPHRPMRDYSQFGPFVFEATRYRATVREAAARFSGV